MNNTTSYAQFIKDLKQNIIQSRYYAARLANQEQLLLYFKTGEILFQKIVAEKWGSNVLGTIANDLQKHMPGLRGFSSRNLQKMRQFYTGYSKTIIGQLLTVQLSQKIYTENKPLFTPLTTAQIDKILRGDSLSGINTPSVTAKLMSDILTGFLCISFSHHIVLLDKCKSLEEMTFYIIQSSTQYWSVNILEHQIKSDLYGKQGKLPNNFSETLPEYLKPSAIQVFNDEYLVDYMNLQGNEDEREVENRIVANIKDFILRMGKGFSFIGNQFRIELDGEEFFIDLLFFNRHLQCLVAFELKKGKFKPEYAGQLNFYLNVLDEKVKLANENSSIGIVLCKEKSNTIVEYSVRSIDKAMGVATFRTTKEIPKEIKGVLPDTEELRKLF
jgi:predicted nuclease of restriction endonuclease-like (RecB) superfamily